MGNPGARWEERQGTLMNAAMLMSFLEEEKQARCPCFTLASRLSCPTVSISFSPWLRDL